MAGGRLGRISFRVAGKREIGAPLLRWAGSEGSGVAALRRWTGKIAGPYGARRGTGACLYEKTYCFTVINGPLGVDTPSTVAVTARSPSGALGGTRTTNWNSPAQQGAAPA